MKLLKTTAVLLTLVFLNSCASAYKPVQPDALSYNSVHRENGITMEYQYDLLRKKYAKKEEKRDVRLVAVKIQNNTGTDIMFERDFTLTYENGKEPILMPRDRVFSSLKQQPATHLFYLLLTPITFQTTTTNSYGIQETSSSFPVGLIVGPALAGGNLIAASSANKKFKGQLEAYDLRGKVIPNGETVYGLIGIRADNYDALRIKIMQRNIVLQDPDKI